MGKSIHLLKDTLTLLKVMTFFSPLHTFLYYENCLCFHPHCCFELQQEPFTDTSIAFIQGQVAKAAFKQNNKKKSEACFYKLYCFLLQSC